LDIHVLAVVDECRDADLLDLVGQLSGQPKAVIDELGVDDLSAVMGVVGDFVPGGRGTGTTSSP
jgi:hypothetical protein